MAFEVSINCPATAKLALVTWPLGFLGGMAARISRSEGDGTRLEAGWRQGIGPDAGIC